MINLRGLRGTADLPVIPLDAVTGVINGGDSITPGTYASGYIDPFAPVGSVSNPTGGQFQYTQSVTSSGITSWLANNSTTLVALSALVGVLAFVTGRRR